MILLHVDVHACIELSGYTSITPLHEVIMRGHPEDQHYASFADPCAEELDSITRPPLACTDAHYAHYIDILNNG